MSRKRDEKRASELGNELKNMRENESRRRGYTVTQSMVAEEAGITQAALSQYEHGKRVPDKNLYEKIASYFEKK